MKKIIVFLGAVVSFSMNAMDQEVKTSEKELYLKMCFAVVDRWKTDKIGTEVGSCAFKGLLDDALTILGPLGKDLEPLPNSWNIDYKLGFIALKKKSPEVLEALLKHNLSLDVKEKGKTLKEQCSEDIKDILRKLDNPHRNPDYSGEKNLNVLVRSLQASSQCLALITEYERKKQAEKFNPFADDEPKPE